MSEIKNKILEITEVIMKKDFTAKGLFSGYSGRAIYFAYINKLYNDQQLNDDMENALEVSLDMFNDVDSTHTFADGFAGVCWSMNHLVKHSKVEADIDSLFHDIDQYLIGSSQNDLKFSFFDFMHGGLGAGMYFLDRLPNANAHDHLVNTITSLHEYAEFSGKDIIWIYKHPYISDDTTIDEYNLGLAHGIPSILWFLCKCYEQNIEQEKCSYLIEGTMNWLLKQKLNSTHLSIYSSVVKKGIEPDKKSRLGWCYGDLGIALSVWQAGKALNNEKWKQEAIAIMKHASLRKSLAENSIIDAGICHGTAGIAHIFNRFYFETKIEVFKITANYWIDQTLKMATHHDGLAGYKTYRQETGWINEHGILEGIAGIGLVLASHISDEEPVWDRCLLLS